MRLRALAIGVLLISLVPLLLTPVVPTFDYYNHVGRYYVLTHIDALAYLRQSYVAAWNVLPNLGLDVVAFPFFKLLPPLVAAKCVVALILVVQFTGVLAFARALNGRLDPLGVLLAGILLYSYILGWGFANFLFATGLSFWGLALWLRLRGRRIVAVLACSALAVVIFFCHGFAFALYGLTLALLEFGFWLRTRPRRLSALAAAAVAVAVQAIVPALLFRMAPTSEAGQSMGEMLAAHEAAGTVGTRIAEHVNHQAMAIVRVADSPYLALDVLTFVAVLALLVWGWRRRLVGAHPAIVPALLVFAALSVLTPPSLFGVGKISDRVPLMACLVLAASLCAPARAALPGARAGTSSAGSDRTVLVRAFAAILLIRLAATMAGYLQYHADFADFNAIVRRVPAHAIVAGATPPALLERDQDAMRCQMYAPLLLPLHGNPVPLFAIPSQQPLEQIGELHRRAEAADEGGALDDVLQKPVPDFRYYVACGYTAIPTGRFDVLARRGRFMLVRARAPSGAGG